MKSRESGTVIMESLFTLSLRGISVQVSKDILQELPKHSVFTNLVYNQHSCDLADILESDRYDVIIDINRSASLFYHILDYIENGELHYPQNVCSAVILKELAFWGYSESDLAPCCLDRVLEEREKDCKYNMIAEEWVYFKGTAELLHTEERLDRTCEKNAHTNRLNNHKSRHYTDGIDIVGDLPKTNCQKEMEGQTTTGKKENRRKRNTENKYLQAINYILSDPLASLPGKVKEYFVVPLCIFAICVNMDT